MAKKSANQLYAEKHIAGLTTTWFEGYHHDVFIIAIDGQTRFSDRDPQVAWAEAAAYAQRKVADLKERREEIKVIKMLKAFLPSVNACLSPKDKKAVARALERLEHSMAQAGASVR